MNVSLLFLLFSAFPERESERTSECEVYEEQNFLLRRRVTESTQRSIPGTASTRSTTAAKIPEPLYKVPSVPERSVLGKRSGKRQAPTAPQVPPGVPPRAPVSRGEREESLSLLGEQICAHFVVEKGN